MKKAGNRLLHLVIAAVAVINLVFLFLFQYGLSSATPAVQAATRASEERAAYDAASGFSAQTTISNSNAVIVTSGQTEEETEAATEDAAAETAPAEEILPDTAEEPIDEKPEEIIAEKETNEESASAEEPEPAANAVPVITLSSDLPEIPSDSLSRLPGYLHDLGLISADDGYGNDISDQISAEYEEISADTMEYHVIFSVTNRAGETVTEECFITARSDHPVLELTTDTITLALYEEFNYNSYIQTARDIDGSELYDAISLDGYIDTENPGVYEITYSTVSRVNGEMVERTLTVVVEG